MSTAGYLERLGVAAGPPTLATLVAVHRAHVERVPYDNLDIMLGRPPSVTPSDSLARIAATGRAGYCFHQNGALELVLRELGFEVTRRHGHVWTKPEHRDRTELNHLVLTVAGLATASNPGGVWWPDAGLGEGFFDPLPVLDGTHVDGPLTFLIHHVGAGSWSFTNDARGAFAGLEVRPRPCGTDDVAAAHADLSTPPDGPFTKMLVVQRRTAGSQETVRACTAVRLDAVGRHEADLTTYDEWRAALDAIGLPLADVDPTELHALWARSWAAHRDWDAQGRP